MEYNVASWADDAGKIRRDFKGQYSRGFAMTKRDPEVKKRFLKKLGLKRTPPGKAVDHIKPLIDGGPETVANIQLITKKQHEVKTAREARARAKKKKK